MNDLVDSRRMEIAELCRRLHVRRLDAFGSAVKGGFDPLASDLDFLVEFEPLPPAEYAEAYFSLKEGLEAIFGRPVDVINPTSVENPYFRESVEAARESVYAA
jgi:predicted nucleotidyltransferase